MRSAGRGMKATFVREFTTGGGVQYLFKVEPPVTAYDEPETPYDHLIASAVKHSTAHETYLFPSDENGEIQHWVELKGSQRRTTDIMRVMREAGYEVAEGPNG